MDVLYKPGIFHIMVVRNEGGLRSWEEVIGDKLWRRDISHLSYEDRAKSIVDVWNDTLVPGESRRELISVHKIVITKEEIMVNDLPMAIDKEEQA